MAQRPKLPRIGPEMERWCALLENEVSAWRQVQTKLMFGLLAVYRGDRIFAALPKTRAAGTANSLLIKLPRVRDKRLVAASGPGKAWVGFEMQSADDIPEVLRLLQRAYRKAGPG